MAMIKECLSNYDGLCRERHYSSQDFFCGKFLHLSMGIVWLYLQQNMPLFLLERVRLRTEMLKQNLNQFIVEKRMIIPALHTEQIIIRRVFHLENNSWKLE